MQTRLNHIFKNMKQRCYNFKNPDFEYYGTRGIRICDEWNNREKSGIENYSKGFIAFKEWALTHGYREDLTIDRINVNKDYSPDNCRWVSMKVQNNNHRNNRLITYRGKKQTLKLWCEELNLKYGTVLSRINNYGWSVTRAFETKTKTMRGKITYKGMTKSLAQWCRELGLNYDKTKHRLLSHWSVETAFEG